MRGRDDWRCGMKEPGPGLLEARDHGAEHFNGKQERQRKTAMKTISVVRDILEANNRIAGQNRSIFDQNRLFVINLMSSPGSGKTTLLEKTIDALKDEMGIGVIEGDIQSSHDADRIARKGVQVVQINTGGACHLDGNMIRDAFESMDLGAIELLVVENVGNLVCPAEFNMGEDIKIMILSVTEGHDKPAKYPLMFRESGVLLINKIDLLPYLDCGLEDFHGEVLKVNPDMTMFDVSCKTGEGLEGWFQWLRGCVKACAVA
jgi:hydrogenase nickel incorporation protein HypB